MKKIFFLLLPFALFLLPSRVSAQSRLTYPIPGLGYCRDAKECSLYCQIPENKAPCWSYGKYRLGSDVLGVSTMSEEEKRQMQQKAKQYNVVFPIADLGGCADPQECRDFCEQPINEQACMDFAKKKGFQKEVRDGTSLDRQKKDELIEKAQTELGCTSIESCSKICESDHTRCEAFARKHGVYQEPSESRGRYSAEEKVQLMQKAQSELGCTSMESCKFACEKNPERCMNFAKKHGFDRPEPRDRQEETESREEMEIENRNEGQQPSSGARPINDGTNYISPSGCRNEAECKRWCESHPEQCPGFSEAKNRRESGKREHELKKKNLENQQQKQKEEWESNREMMQQRSPSSGGESPNYPSTLTQPVYQTTQPSSDYYAPPPTQPATP